MVTMASETDEQLAHFTQKGDNNAFAEIMHRYEDKLFRYAKKLITDEHEAKDVVQNAFMKAYKNMQSFDIKRKFSSWIYRITHNEAMNVLRKRKRTTNGIDKTVFESIQDDAPTIEEKIEQEDVKIEITALLDFLPDDYKEPLLLFYSEEKSYGEISDILRMPTGTVGTRINRGKKMLAALYEQHYG
ncbi:sigma-70 family RNA polymerase sigma factor [bacterium]|uniref:RNA polymerase sigma factor SigW n=2 Tax=Katanobacteria TaxID=422282 RepID=A0A2M7WZK1_UNCKA|nr:sigma-70 family RNA polymerase sigma factor [bacterium]PIP56046.1 MAG: RNA polymerase subunit sigma [candidate division WWE3 bacterium CG22_combo_CG10-13_8_21_14_all_39_12]PJA39021.1 MAG: RNA polymerase sigma factor SigW [candidate division WWE3 bacterium CG_4_9_14_3_um_filter_39_7]